MHKKSAALCAALITAVSFAAVAPSAQASTDTFAVAARKAGYSASTIAQIERHHGQNAVPVTFTAGPLTTVATRQVSSAARTISPNAVYDPTTTCLTDKGTAYGKNSLGNKLMSETMELYFCWQHYSTVPGPEYQFHNRISSVWSASTVTSHLSHHTFEAAEVYGWQYQGLDDTGNYGPNYTGASTDRGVTVERRAHWHFDVGYGPVAIHGNCYPYIRITLNGAGNGYTYTGAPN